MSLTTSNNADEKYNSLLEHFNNPEFNAFEAGPVVNECQDNCRVLLRNVPRKLKHHAIDSMLGQFGTIVDINIPKNQDNFNNREGFMSVFVEFSTFSEAEKTIRELNDGQNIGLQIRASFAHQKLDKDPVKFVAQPVPSIEPKEINTRVPFTVKFEVENDDVHERVTAFERKNITLCLSYGASKQRETSIKLANQSKGSYDEESSCFTFNSELIALETPIKKCSMCKNEAFLRCEKTSLYFCSIRCSLLKMEPTVDEVSVDKNEVKYCESIKLNDRVIITGIINEKCVYVRRASCDDCHIMNSIFKLSKKAPKLKDFPDVGDLVLARHYDQVYRAKVLQNSDDDDYAITVQLIDFGNTARVFLSDLMQISQECQRIECFSHKVILKDVMIDAINQDIISFLVTLQEEKIELTVKWIEGSLVVLFDKALMMDINEKIVALSVINEVSLAGEYGARFDYEPQQLIRFAPNQKLFVISMEFFEKNGAIFCLAETNVKDFLELYKAINIYGNKNSTFRTGIPEFDYIICLAFCNKQWHRAVISKTFGDGKPECMLIDLCCIQRVSVNDIIPMPKTFKDPPPLAQICQIEGCELKAKDVKKFVTDFIEEGKMVFVDEILQGKNNSVILRINSVLRHAIKLTQS